MAKILYVEDEPFLGKIVSESLETKGFEIKWITDGAKAVDAFNEFQPDICILDVMLPNKNGFEIGKEIRAITATIPIIFLTAKTQTEDVLEGFQSGGNDYVRKPFSVEELVVRIQNLMNLSLEKIESNFDEISIGNLTFKPKKFELWNGEQQRDLSYRETQLLNIFIENKNGTIERSLILNKIWGDDSFYNSRNLDVYIKKMRNYFKEDERVQIKTLKGVGYHFIVP